MNKFFQFHGVDVKVSNGFLGKLIATFFVPAVLWVAEQFRGEIDFLIFYLNLSLFALIPIFLIYYIYFKLYASEYIDQKFIGIDENGFYTQNVRYSWDEMKFIYIKYVGHYKIKYNASNYSNIIRFDINHKTHEYHFKLEGEHDFDQYQAMLDMMYELKIDFIEETALVGYTRKMILRESK